MGTMIINGRPVEFTDEKNVLAVIHKAGIDMPTLCYYSELSTYGACRMCVVEDARGKIDSSCSMEPRDGLEIRTNTARLLRYRRMILELLLAAHECDCTVCSKSGSCRLQMLAHRYGVKRVRFEDTRERLPQDESSYAIIRNPNKCILCGDCVRVCREIQGMGILDFVNRGSEARVRPAFNEPMIHTRCISCGQCAAVCPTNAIRVRRHIDDVWKAIFDPKKRVVAQIAPAVRVALGERFGLEPGVNSIGKVVAALRTLGFDHVTDTTLGADFTVMEEAAELMQRLEDGGPFPMFTSCCPAWVEFAEKYHHDLIPHLSSTKSPMQIMGAMIKTYWAEKMNIDPKKIFSVAVMPCTAKKYECERDDTMTASGYQDVDAVITTREFANYIRQAGIEFNALEEQEADSPLGPYSGAGTIFGATGGVMEAALRTAYFYITGKELAALDFYQVRGLAGIKEAKIDIEGTEVRVAVVNQLGNLSEFLETIKQSIKAGGEPLYHFVEVMACRGGCVGGGGQPYGCTDEVRKQRAAGLYTDDERAVIRIT